jgi:hypothetical protein
MASSYKYLGSNDRVVSSNTLEAAVSASKGGGWSIADVGSPVAFNQISSGGTHYFDVTTGRVSGSVESTTSQLKKTIHNELAKVLNGHNEDGSIINFGLDSDALTTNNLMQEAFFISIKRSQFKDRIKKGTVTAKITVSSGVVITISDLKNDSSTVTRTCETGEYGILFYKSVSGGSLDGSVTVDSTILGLVFYEAGIIVVSPYVFSDFSSGVDVTNSAAVITSNKYGILASVPTNNFNSSTIGDAMINSTIDTCSTTFANLLTELWFMSVTELNSTVYFCRAFNNEFNYSSNPTYVSSGQIVVKESDPMAQPVSYITSVGLYDDNNQLLAVAKLSTPIKKTPDTELIARVRLDF